MKATARRESTFVLRLAALACVAFACVAIFATARRFSGTVDEPAHLAAGLQWLTTGEYWYDLPHPPLARVMIALGPYLHGARSTGAPAVFDEGARILGAGQHYVDTLASARHGTIWFFLLLTAIVWAWTRRIAGEGAALIATLLVVCNPNVLAHAGLATTDVACAATTTLALFAGVCWLDRPSWRRTAFFGFAIGLAVASRLSAVAFVAVPLVACVVVRRIAVRRWTAGDDTPVGVAAMRLASAGLLAVLVVFATYRFSAQPFIGGLRTFFLHGSSGHPTFLLGRPSNRGWWYYFPIALLVKTPLPLLALAVLGAAVGLRELRARREWHAVAPLVSALGILAVSMPVRVDLGVRLVLPMYPLMAIVGAVGTRELVRSAHSRTGPFVAGGLLAASVAIAARAHPDYLAYFNVLAGARPERVLVDSNLDWGQDLYRLRDTLAAHGIRDSVRIAYFGTADVSAAGVPNARLLGLHEHATGWIAASETFLAGEWVGRAYQWLLAYPPAVRIGPSMRLWYIPDTATTDSSLR